MENIAQTSALRSGYRFAQQVSLSGDSPKPPIGFIGALKNFVITDLPSVGSTIYTSVKVTYEVMGMQVVEASVKCGKHIIASCEMKIFLSQEEQKA